ncbi:MAG: hypothetical protein IPH62_01980 [Ignavibacteriae bacterium]|nr:hypothetical protein [Ignavibacteriota bacterium]
MSDEKKEKILFKRSLLHKVVNVFIGFFAVFLFLLIAFFGFSQTKTFRNFLRSQIITQVTPLINGKLYIKEIDGSIFSSIILHKIVLSSGTDTLINADEITIKTSPIHLLLKRILVREISVKNTSINLLQDKDGVWNISKMFIPDNEPEDTSKSTFPFTIQVNNLNFQNLAFTRQTFSNLNSNKFYDHINTDDLKLNEIFLDAKIFANINSSLVRLYLNNFSVNPNFNSFNLNKFSGEFELNENFAQVRNLKFKTDSSNVSLNAKIDKLNILGNVELQEFNDYPLEVELNANPFNFDDLSTFIQATDFIKGSIDVNMKAKGFFGDFDISKLNINYQNTNLNLKGNVKNLHTPEKLFFDAEIFNSTVVESEIYYLIKGLEIPKYDNLVVTNLNLKYKGEPTKFNAELNGNVNDGKIYLKTFLNLKKTRMEYDIDFTSENIDLFPIFGVTSSINSSGKIKGVGTNPNNMNANFYANVNSSTFNNISFDSLNLVSEINSKIFNLNLNSLINNAKTSVNGVLDLTNSESPAYDLFGTIKNFNLQTFTNERKDSSNLNLSFTAKGNNLELDNLIGNFNVKLEPSFLRDIILEETNINIALTKNELERNINLVSDFVDFNINGNFSLEKAVNLIIYEAETITNLISQKIDELNPIENDKQKTPLKDLIKIDPIIYENVEFNYDFKFKDFKLIALFLKNDELDISGTGEGLVKNDSLHFTITTDINIDNLLNKRDSLLLYFSNTTANLNFNRDNQETSFNKIFGTISVESEKMYAGAELNNIEADFIFNQNELFFNSSLGIGNDLTAEFEGTIETYLTNQTIDFYNINLNYKNIPWTSFDTSSISFAESGIQLSNLILENTNAAININGQINNDQSHNFFVDVENLPAAVLSTYFVNENDKPIDGDVNMKFSSSGFLSEPDLDMEISINDISYNNSKFGSLIGSLNHYKNLSRVAIFFNNSDLNSVDPILTLTARLPIYLNYIGGNEIIIPESEIEANLNSDNFNIGALGNLIPYVNNQSGIINSQIEIGGTYANPITTGFINLEDGKFTFTENNLEYSLNSNINFRDQYASIDKFEISNHAGSMYSGKINANGIVELREFPFNKINISLNGDLALLGSRSKTKDANIYGDLFIKTDDDWKFKFENDVYTFEGDILVDKADLVYASKNQQNARFNNRLVYKFVEDSSKINWKTQKFIRILNENNFKNNIAKSSSSKFDFNTNIIIKNIASFNFLINPELNQKLNVETTGQLEFETIADEIKTQGSLALLDGSRLEFFNKTFDSKGTIRFESDITDPHLNIVATYIGEIENFEQPGKVEEVAVKLKINSPLSTLGKNPSAENENLSVYVGRTNIENDIPDSKYDASNALSFILLNQLSMDITDEQKSTLIDVAENTAYSFLGSQLTNYFSSALGGLVSNIRFNKYSSDSYKLLFSGKYNNIRYSFGGNTKYMEWNKTDIKFEYLFNPSFLIRVEQKDPIVETTTGEKIQELGLKYKFEF